MADRDLTFVIDPGNEAPVTELHAFLSVDENGEGICAMYLKGRWFTMVSAKPSVVEHMKIHARTIAKRTGKPVRLVKFTSREEIETFGVD